MSNTTHVQTSDCRDCGGQGWPIPRAHSINGNLTVDFVHRCGRRPAPGDDSPIPRGIPDDH